jgi:phosphotransferase system  glucose/maltose/N-acetylglucosamine-specific IIC component
LAANGSSGFLGALAAGFIAGWTIKLFERGLKRLPESLAGAKTLLILPLFSVALMGVLSIAVLEPVIGWLNSAMSAGLQSLNGTSKIFLGFVAGGMEAVDMGGPVNKAAFLFAVASMANGQFDVMSAVLAGAIVPVVIVVIVVKFIQRTRGGKVKAKKLTDDGARLTRYLRGLREFMTVSEADRIKMLQSPQGAEQFGTVIGGDKVRLIKLYEKLLPFAVIFGIEKSWGAILQVYYTEVNYSPDYFHGYMMGNNFGYWLGSLNSTSRTLSSMEASRIARETMARSSSWSSGGSSSSGFSGGGGGSSGGGGGGGGGW